MAEMPIRYCRQCEVKRCEKDSFFCSRACMKKYNEEKWNVR